MVLLDFVQREKTGLDTVVVAGREPLEDVARGGGRIIHSQSTKLRKISIILSK